MKAGKNKLLIDLEGESLIYWTLKSVFSASSTNWVGIIGQPKDKNLLLNSAKDFAHKVHWINGGDTRQKSVFNGLKALPKDSEDSSTYSSGCVFEYNLDIFFLS